SLSGSQTGVNYQLKKNGNDEGSPVAGDGNPIPFGSQPAGTYTVVATNATTNCTATMTGSAVITNSTLAVSLASAGNVTTICGAGPVTLTATASGGTPGYTNYEFFKNNSSVQSSASNTYNATAPGTYKVTVTDSVPCTKTSSDLTLTAAVPSSETISGA